MTVHALLVGVNAYAHVPSRLSGCVNDALAVRRFLLECAGASAENLTLLLSPAPGEAHPDVDLSAVPRAGAANLRAALDDLGARAQHDDQVILYVAGHGVLARGEGEGDKEYGFAPEDIVPRVTGGYDNLVFHEQMRAALTPAMAAGAMVCAIFDTCHSGNATPEADERGLPVAELSRAEWESIFGAPSRPGPGDGVAWEHDDLPFEWVIFTACRDVETAKEQKDPVPHGAFTLALLAALRAIPAAEVSARRWCDLAPPVRAMVRRLVAHQRWSPQTPLIEGESQHLILGGAWSPIAPRFEALARADGAFAIDGGLIHGLDVDAIVEVLTPGDEALSLGRARVEIVEPAASYARLIAERDARAAIVAPSPPKPRLRAAIHGAPAAVAAAIMSAPDAAEWLAIAAPGEAADAAIVPFPGAIPAFARAAPRWCGATGGLAIVPFSRAKAAIVPDEVIAYAPPPGARDAPGDPAAIGEAIGAGLVHRARYAAILARAGADPALRAAIDVSLRAGPDRARRDPDASGAFTLTLGEPFWIAIESRAAAPLAASLVACSNDGNVIVPWPAELRIERELTLLGRDRAAPLKPSVRLDQASSLYTFKLFLALDRPPIAGWAMSDTVQDRLLAALSAPVAGLGGVCATPGVEVWDLPVRIHRKVG